MVMKIHLSKPLVCSIDFLVSLRFSYLFRFSDGLRFSSSEFGGEVIRRIINTLDADAVGFSAILSTDAFFLSVCAKIAS